MTPHEIKHRMAWLRQEAFSERSITSNDTAAEVDEIERLALSAIQTEELRRPDTNQEQAGVEAYTQWKANVSNERSSAYGGNLHDLARRIYVAMINAAPQEISAEASRQADVESSKAKKPGAPASTPCRTGEAETPCGAAPSIQSPRGT